MPEPDEPPVDVGQGLMDRPSVALRLNPFDARAVGVGLAMRRPGDALVAVSMGPMAAEAILREALAAGADRAILVSDGALRGSDSLVTALVLTRAVRALGAELVLTGAFSTDSGTGQLPPELAALLGWPVISHARSISGPGDREEYEVRRDVRGGWAEERARSPLVVSVGEKIVKPPRPSDAERAAAQGRPIERWDVAALGLDPPSVGLEGSPTRVVALRADAPTRRARLFADGPIGQRVVEAMEGIGGRSDPLRIVSRVPSRDEPRPGPEVWVHCPADRGSIDGASLSILSEARRSLPGFSTVAVRFLEEDPSPTEGSVPDGLGLSAAGADRILELVAPTGGLDSGGAARSLLAAWGSGPRPSAVLFVSDPEGREIAGQLAASAGLGCVGDATAFGPDGPASVRYWKPSFGGEYLAEIAVRGSPSVATIRPGAFGAAPELGGTAIPTQRIPGSAGTRSVRRGRVVREVDPGEADLERSELVVTVGMGIGGPEGIARLRPTLARWGAALGATRRVVDAGWLPPGLQVGLTGRSIAPRLAILLGVGKATNHLVGLRRAGRILAVNPDPAAPVFRYVDAGVVGPWEEALPFLNERLTRDPGGPAG